MRQPPLPARKSARDLGHYDLYPAFPIAPDKIRLGYDELARALAPHRRIVLDGYVGVEWDAVRAQLDAAYARLGAHPAWRDVRQALKPESALEALVAPFLGGADPLFGTRFTGTLRDFFDPHKLAQLEPDDSAELTIIYGCGAALADWDGALVYVDVPKNEIQYRARAGIICNLGASQPADAKAMYKRFYFVDWVALNRHKAELAARADWIVDAQRTDEPSALRGSDLRAALDEMSGSYFRVRPWFEPGPWGGQWLKQHIPELPQDAPNYAWSFELIASENGLVLASAERAGGAARLLECSFDWLMFHAHRRVLGAAADAFGYEFPIRFDYLDTFEGGDLSIQCHPRLDYIRAHFGERLTQDETYYILDCQPGARVWLGFQADTDPAAFRRALEASAAQGTRVSMEQFVRSEPSRKHALYLIPNGTIHGAGVNNLVLEISAAPYIFTFKLYDWLRLDLEGKPRPLNLARAFENLELTRRGERVPRELVAEPKIVATFASGRLVHLPTHPDHLYDVERFEFTDTVTAATEGMCHALNVVDGAGVTLETADGHRAHFHYAETFVVPAAANEYRLTNAGGGEVKVVKAFVKSSALEWFR